MKIISLLISLFGIIKTKELECVSVINRKCMPRPKILDVNEGVGEALFYPYNVLVNKCSGSCNTLDDPMAKLCVPNIIKRVNMKVYNFLMRLNETRNVLWHESCKCVCRLNSSVCNSKQIWNSDTCSCVCKNKLIGKIISECTSLINETMMNNKMSITNDDTTKSIFIGLFSVLMLAGITCFCIFAYLKINMLIIKITRAIIKCTIYFIRVIMRINLIYHKYKIMSIKSLKIKNESMFYSNDMIQLNNFDSRLLKINKKENRDNNNIYYIFYKINKPEHNINSINNLYFVINYLCGTIEKIDGSNNRYFVFDKNNVVFDKNRLINKENIDLFYDLWDAIINKIKYLRRDDVIFDDNEVTIKDWNKIRFCSDVVIPNDVLINSYSLVIVINYVIEKNDEFIPEIYIDEGYFEKV